MKTRTIAGWGATVLLSAAVAGAQPAPGQGGWGGRPGGPGGPGGMMGRAARVLQLTDEQKAAFRKTMEQQRPQMQALHQQMSENRTKLKELLDGGNPDPAAVGKLVIQEHQLREQGKAQREQAQQALRALLTPEQQAKFDVLEQMKPGPGDMGPGGPGGRHWGGPGPEARKKGAPAPQQ